MFPTFSRFLNFVLYFRVLCACKKYSFIFLYRKATKRKMWVEFLPFLQLLNNRNKLYELYISKTYKIKAKEEERKSFFYSAMKVEWLLYFLTHFYRRGRGGQKEGFKKNFHTNFNCEGVWTPLGKIADIFVYLWNANSQH